MKKIKDLKIIRGVKEMRQFRSQLVQVGNSLGFVPTMGFLHQGHLSLVRRARAENDVAVVSIYVNPLQFGLNENWQSYPRDLERDLALLRGEKVDAVFVPVDEEMWGKDIGYLVLGTRKRKRDAKKRIAGEATIKKFDLVIPPDFLTNCLCGLKRPGHFTGVAIVVEKFFNLIEPKRVYFGQKDYQQCLVVKRLIKDLDYDIEMRILETIREKDGLAMSSRNIYLSVDERKVASNLYRALMMTAAACQNAATVGQAERVGRDFLKKEPLIELEYLEIRDAETLEKFVNFQKYRQKKPALLIAAAIKIGKTRLIDNVIL